MSPVLRHVTYVLNSDVEGRVAYAIFPSKLSGSDLPLCVFSTLNREACSGINAAETIAENISKQLNLSWQDFRFAEVITHRGYGRPRGYYDYHIVNFKKPTSWRTTISADYWQDVECPKPVFEAFKHLIGTFTKPAENITRARECYARYTDAQLSEEIRWMEDCLADLEQHANDCRIKYRDMLMTPEAARIKGYKFDPKGPRFDTVDSKKELSGAWVDLKDSHLLGQHVGQLYYGPSERPKPFTIWS